MKEMNQRRKSGVRARSAVPPPLQATATRTVRFQEVDLLGVVWHGRYVEYFEDGRCALGKAYGLDYKDFFREGFKAPIVKIEIEYKHPLFLDDVFSTETSLLWTEAVRLNHIYVLKRNSDGQVLARGKTVQLLLDRDDKLLLAWPRYFLRFRKNWRQGTLRRSDE